MTIWLAALCSFGILGAIVIPFALSARFIKWAVENEHMVFLCAKKTKYKKQGINTQ